MNAFSCMLILIATLPLPSEQTPDDLCGAYTLYVALRSLDCPLDTFDGFEKSLGPPPRGGYSLAELAEAAHKLKFQTLGVRTSLESLASRQGRFACIAHMNKDHFVLIAQIDETRLEIIDPPRKYSVNRDVWNKVWQGDAMLISASPLLSENDVSQMQTDSSVRRKMYRTVAFSLAVVAVLASLFLFWHRNTRETR